MRMTTLNQVARLFEMPSHLAISYYFLSSLITHYLK